MAQFVGTSSSSFNRLFGGGVKRGGLTLVHVGCEHQDLFRIAFAKLFSDKGHSVLIYDFHGDFTGKLAHLYGFPVKGVKIDPNIRRGTFFSKLTGVVRGSKAPDVIIVNDLDALRDVSPNEYRRLIAVATPSKAAVIFLSPVSTTRTPKSHRYNKQLKRLELSLPLVLQVTVGDVVEKDFVFHIGAKRVAGSSTPTAKARIKLDYQEIPTAARGRNRIIPSQIITKGKFPDRGVLAQQTRLTVESQEDGVSEQPLLKPGELRGGAEEFSENPVDAAVQLDGDVAVAVQPEEDEKVEVTTEPMETEAWGPDSEPEECPGCSGTQLKRVTAWQEVDGLVTAMFRCEDCRRQFKHSYSVEEAPADISEEAPKRTVRGFEVVGDKGSPVMGEQPLLKPGETVSDKEGRRKKVIDNRDPSQKGVGDPDKIIREHRSAIPIVSGDSDVGADRLSGSLNARTTKNAKGEIESGGIRMKVEVKEPGQGVIMETAKPKSKRKKSKRKSKRKKSKAKRAKTRRKSRKSSSKSSPSEKTEKTSEGSGLVNADALSGSSTSRKKVGGTMAVEG